ncbi:hypothetical protein LAZ67_2000830 [Cordylochernes scorpioides]|uniref:Uncharacterized protein n=1 Tax=Cordylochernes scorpioides TaxID=51811 RepID=A0ABY6K1J6_9ARAC|nr:hypothetical protein LAZ67_2000830 [Cordylochernes scorpioides]
MTPISLKTTHKHITPDTAITTGFITGHTWIGANKHNKSKHDSSSCRHCGGPPETTEHICLEYPPLDNNRSILFSNCCSASHKAVEDSHPQTNRPRLTPKQAPQNLISQIRAQSIKPLLITPILHLHLKSH